MPLRLIHTIAVVFICIINLQAANMKSSATPKPDFAFPKQTAVKAREQLSEALTRGDATGCVRAIIDLQISQTLIDPDSVVSVMPEISRISADASDPVAKSLLNILQARIYSEIYHSDRWNYDRRQIPDTPIPTDYRLWSGRQFRTVIDSLAQSALSDAQTLQRLPLRDFSSIINCPKESASYFPTLLDFVAWQSIGLLQDGVRFHDILPYQCLDPGYTFPAASSPASIAAKKISSIYSMLLKATGNNESPLLYILTERARFFTNCVYNSSEEFARAKTYANLMLLAKKYASNPSSAIPLISASDYATEGDTPSYYSALESFVRHHPNAEPTAAIRYRMETMTSPYTNLNMPSAVYPGEPFTISVDSRGVKQATVNFYRLPDRISSQYSVKVANPSTYPLVATKKVDLSSVDKFGGDTTITATLEKPGYYFAVITTSPAIKSRDTQRRVIHCSALSLATLRLNDIDAIAFNPLSGEAVGGAAIYSSNDNEKNFVSIGSTDAYGYLRIAAEKSPLSRYVTLSIRKDGDEFAPYVDVHPLYHGNRMQTFVNAYTDLAIYHPGDTVRWAAIVYTAAGAQHSPVVGKDVKVEMLDANYTEIEDAVKECPTDEFGRIEGSFEIPKGLLQGNFSLRISTGDTTDDVYFMVSDYKLPGFMIECDTPEQDTPAPGSISLSGTVKTYSGMPLSEAEITIDLSSSSMPWWFRSPVGTKFYSISARTDASGRFSVVLDTNVLDAAPSPHGLFTASISATSLSGESQEATVSFIRGNALRIDSQLKSSLDVTGSPMLPIKVVDFKNETKDVKIFYSLTPSWISADVHPVTGSFMSSTPRVDWSNIPSGRYRLSMAIEDSRADSVVNEIVVYRPSDRKMPAGISDVLWSPFNNNFHINVDRTGKGSILIAAGSGTTHAIFVLSDSARIIERRWLSLSEGFHKIPVEVSPDAVSPRLTLYAARDMKSTELSLGIEVPHPERNLIIRAESFRDRIVPGTSETWKFTTVDGDGTPRRSAMILDMYNSALDALTSKPWTLTLSNIYIPSLSLDSWNFDRSNNLSLRQDSQHYTSFSIRKPQFLTYDYPLYTTADRRYGIMLNSMAVAARGVSTDVTADEGASSVMEVKMAAPRMMRKEAIEEESAVADTDDALELAETVVTGSPESAPAAPKMAYRNGDATLAFFRPMLVTDDDGTLSFTFTVPDANTTWAFNALGFTSGRMATASLSRKFLANKPVMVQPNLPRFLRQGDRVAVSSLIMNNSDEEQRITTVTELFDPVTSKVIERTDTVLVLAPTQSAPATVSFRAPTDAPFIGFRVKASTLAFADGEQRLIPILEAAEPLIETRPFYISPDSTAFSMTLPKIPANASVTLQYCENPTWYVVTALPGLSATDPRTSNQAADNYYSAAVAKGLLARYPEIGRAIAEWSKTDKSDGVLTSMLERNADLKTVLLQATPWMLDARSDSERMKRLVLLLDSSNIDRVLRQSLNFLRQTQRAAGGWSWTKDFKEPSLWVTERILARFAELRQAGYLVADKEITEMINPAFRYYNDAHAETLKLNKKYSDLTLTMLHTLWPDAPSSTTSRTIMANTIQHIVRDWKHFDITGKAESAIILHANGYPSVARQIMASIEDFAVSSPEKGMWWPSTTSSDEYFTLLTTVECLRAMVATDIPTSNTDKVIQWMILQKEANDWKSSMATSLITSSIINMADRWIVPAAPSRFSLGGKTLDANATDSRLGSFRIPIDASEASGATLTVTRAGSTPAWGAVYCRFKTVMADIPAVEIPDLKITKTLLKKHGTEWVEARNLKVGDRVRVNLTIVSKRHMDYVTVTDNRAACLEPVEQTPTPLYTDGLCFYRQNGDNTTSLFIGTLPPGTYQLGYDMWVNNAGEFASGTAAIQSQYAPQLAAHSSGSIVTVAPKE